MTWRVLGLLLLLGSAGALLSWEIQDAPELDSDAREWLPLSIAPDFELPLLADPEHPLGYAPGHYPTFQLSERSETVVLLDFWADWCAPCIAKFPYLENIRERYGAKGFEVYGVLKTFPTWRALKWFEGNGGAPFPQLQDEARDVAGSFRVAAIPRMFLVGPQEEILWECTGCSDLEEALPFVLDSILRTAGANGIR